MNKFDASSSALGYLFQIRLSLLLSLRKLRDEPLFKIFLETLDDVSFEQDGAPDEIFQTKHHLAAEANLTDYSSDLWKTIRIWCNAIAAGKLDDVGSLYLVTTATAPIRSAASKLREKDRDEAGALVALEQIARSSSNQSNKDGYEAFLALSAERRLALLRQVTIVDRSGDILAAGDLLRSELALTVDREFLDGFLSRLEGWWISRAIVHLKSGEGRAAILSEELEAQVSDLRLQFRSDSLPIDQDILNTPVDTTHYNERVFVTQLGFVDLSKERIKHAIFDYFKAFEQRSRWLREELLYVGELEQYERRIREEWERRFLRMKDRLGSAAADERKKREGNELYTWAEDALIHLRPRCTEPFVCRGTFQMLADAAHVGWHVDFTAKLKSILGSSKEVA